MSRRRHLLAAIFLLLPGLALAQTAAEGRAFGRALEMAKADDWAAASAQADRAAGALGSDVIAWLRLRDGDGAWTDYRDFLARNGDWPGLDTVRRAAEVRMPLALPPAEVVAFFGAAAPLTGVGALRLGDALRDTGRADKAEAVIDTAWTGLSMTRSEQEAMARDWATTVAPLNSQRLDMLLWRGLTGEAEGMLPLVDADWQALARARIAVRRDEDGSSALINGLPAKTRSDPGLAYERYLYRVRQGRWDEAAEYMLRYSTTAATLGRPEMWMERRANLAREALRRGEVATAYGLAASGHGSKGSDYADAEWMAGFIALTRMKDPARAIGHFERFQTLVFTPISLGRAGYWLGLAREAAGDKDGAARAFLAGSGQQTSFYGQLAAERLGIDFEARFASDTAAPDWRTQAFMASSVVRAGYLFLLAGEDGRAAQFFRQAAEGRTPETRAALAQMAIDLGRPHIGIRVAKDAALEGIVLPAQYYPLHAIARQEWPVPTELAMAIARQESEMNPAAASEAGARGLMQLMPATASDVARARGIAHDPARLTRDPMYNARLGTAYLSEMLEYYHGSYVLAAAAYNAGPGRVDQWVKAFGDPRAGADPVVWIESIPYSETRNYVMRILEGMQVYRVRLRGTPMPVQIAADIRKTG